MPTSRSASRANSNARAEIIETLTADHKRVRKAFRDFGKMDAEEDPEGCEALVNQTLAELEVHTSLEEELFYPSVRGALKEADLVDEAEVEHMSAKQLIEQLRAMSPGDDKYSATFTVLGEYVNHHIKEEEREMFPQLERTRGVDWATLQQEMETRREELMAEHMPEMAGEEEEESPLQAVGQAMAEMGSDDKDTGRPRRSGSQPRRATTSRTV